MTIKELFENKKYLKTLTILDVIELIIGGIWYILFTQFEVISACENNDIVKLLAAVGFTFFHTKGAKKFVELFFRKRKSIDSEWYTFLWICGVFILLLFDFFISGGQKLSYLMYSVFSFWSLAIVFAIVRPASAKVL